VLGALIWLLIMRPKFALITALVVAVGAVVLVPAVLKERFNPESARADVALRTDVAQSALDIYSEHPLLGVGVNNFQTAYSERRSAETAGQHRLLHNEQLLVPTASPSQYLNTLAEQGLVGIGALAIFLLLALGSAWRVSKARDPGGWDCIASLFAVVLTASRSPAGVQVVILITLLGIAMTAERLAGCGRNRSSLASL
jgi:O-antigen ligase